MRQPLAAHNHRRVVMAPLGWMTAILLSAPALAYSSPVSRAITREGYQHAYELRFPEALSALAEARRLDPSDPAPLRAVASITWMEILFTQGVGTYHAFQGNPSADTVARPAPPSHLAARFSEHASRALDLAERRAAAMPEDHAQYQLGATVGLLALYRGTVEGRAFAAFLEGRRAVSILKRVREQDATHRESALIPGIYRYAVSTLPWHKRLIATVAGMSGDEEGGIQLLETAAAESAETATDAALVLMVIYNREGRHQEALRHLHQVAARHPGNRLVHLNLAVTALDGGDPATAAQVTTDRYPAVESVAAPHVEGEAALWSYVRGSARAAQAHRGATADLELATGPASRDWIRARAHVELAQLALRSGDPTAQRTHLAAAEHLARRANDDVALERARRIQASGISGLRRSPRASSTTLRKGSIELKR
jgi:tetratricopeptide (TPR) repeat protein